MEIRVLGPLTVEAGLRDGTALGPAQRRLLALLCVRAGQVVSSERLAEDLNLASVGAVRTSVSRLRKAVGDAVLRDPPGYLVRRDVVDAGRFEELLGRARTADPPTAVERYDEALALWRGAAYAEFAEEPWAQAEAVRLDELRSVADEERIEALLNIGRAEDAAAEAERAAAEHPFRERPRELLMTALAVQGRTTEALRAFQAYRTHLADEVGVEPSAELVELEGRIVAGELGRPHRLAEGVAVPRLPADLTPFVGRDAELSALSGLVAQTRLLTLVGPGGIGKTRLALQLARATEGDLDAAFLVELSSVTDPAGITTEFAAALGLDAGEADLDRIVATLADRQVLVVLDNCEHLLRACARVATDLMTQLPEVRLLATSREPLSIAGEAVWPVRPLLVPSAEADAEEIADSDAVQLFMSRCTAVRPGLTLTEDNSADVARICQDLDGIPLAIELAAARARTMGLRDIADGLAAKFELLDRGNQAAPERHQRLGAAFEWSFEQLSEPETTLLVRLRPMESHFPLRAAEILCAADAEEERRVGADLASLVDRSFVQMEERESAVAYRLLPVLREWIFSQAGWQGLFEARAFVVALAQHTEPRLRGTEDHMWSVLLSGPRDVTRQALADTYERHDIAAGSYLAGLVAARTSETAHIGFVGGVRNGYIEQFERAYRAGAELVAPDVDVTVSYLSEPPDPSGFMDPGRGQRAAADLYSAGADVLYHAAGIRAGAGVFEAARREHETTGRHHRVIGVDIDDFVFRGSRLSPYVLTSMRRQVPIDVFAELKRSIAAGDSGSSVAFDLANEGVGLSMTSGCIDHLAEEIQDVRRAIIAGDLPVPRTPDSHEHLWQLRD